MTAVDEFVGTVHERDSAETEIDYRIEEITRNGYTLIEDAITPEDLAFLQSGVIENIYAQQMEEIGGEEKVREIADYGSAKHLLSYDGRFLKLTTDRVILDIVERFLGDFFILNLLNAILIKPSQFNPASSWHRDIPHQHFTSSRPFSISALHIIDDFDSQSGGTALLPGSHRFERFPSTRYVENNAIEIEAKAGTVMVFDSMMYHRAGHNSGKNIRRSISNIYTSPLIRQQISLPILLDGKYSDDPFLSKFLGYETREQGDVLSWRKTRIEQKVGTRLSPLSGKSDTDNENA